MRIVCTSVQLLVGPKATGSFMYLCLQDICEVYLYLQSNQTRVSVGCLSNFAYKVSTYESVCTSVMFVIYIYINAYMFASNKTGRFIYVFPPVSICVQLLIVHFYGVQ